jgi:hypothetical protein
MIEPFAETETDRTKSRWVAKAFHEFGRPRATLRSLFYYALQREEPDYPICGGFVGEIRATRRYHFSDGARLAKWVERARRLGYLPEGAMLEDRGEEIFLHEPPDSNRFYRLELWLERSALSPLILPVCRRLGVTLAALSGRPSREALEQLLIRSETPTTLLCLSDLSPRGVSFSRELALVIASAGKGDIRARRIALTPRQALDLKIPMLPGEGKSKEDRERYKRYLKPYGLSPKTMAELDALEVYHPRGLAGFLDELLSRYLAAADDEQWLLDLRRGILPGREDVDASARSASKP